MMLVFGKQRWKCEEQLLCWCLHLLQSLATLTSKARSIPEPVWQETVSRTDFIAASRKQHLIGVFFFFFFHLKRKKSLYIFCDICFSNIQILWFCGSPVCYLLKQDYSMNDGAFFQVGREDVWTLCAPCCVSSPYPFVRRGNLASSGPPISHSVWKSEGSIRDALWVVPSF